MKNLLFTALKTTALTIIVLLMSQIRIGQLRICDHVGALVNSPKVQSPIRVVSSNFDFTDGRRGKGQKGSAVSGVRKESGAETSEAPAEGR
jgi:hypothetical protein